MKIKRKAWILKNKGFTLIEMIVTVAIIAIFSGVVLTFIGTGTSVYRNTSSNSKVQMETQETFDKIEDLIIDANRSIYYASGSSNNLGNPITNDIKENSGDGTNSSENKIFIACNEYENNDGTSQYICDVLEWEKSEAKIYYSCKEYKAKSSNAGTAETSETEEFSDKSGENTAVVTSGQNVNVQNRKTLFNRSVLATGILDFRADVSKVKSDKIVRFQLSTENGKKQIQTLHSVSLRNNVDVKKPEEAFEKADAVDVKIKIINAPESMNPGESVMLAYGLTGNDSIDPTTVTWTVLENSDNGSFPSQDHTNGRLTINDNGSGYITVQVSAVSRTGQLVTSAAVKIKINNDKKPTKLIADGQENILLGVGNTYNINDFVNWQIGYSDGSTGTDILESGRISWSGGIVGASVNSNGVITIAKNDTIGKLTDDSVFKLSAKYEVNGEQLNGEVTVRLARIDIIDPARIYYVGDEKPISYEYREGGKLVQVNADRTNVTFPERPEESPGYNKGENFYLNDVGRWKIRIEVSLGGNSRNIYDEKSFSVEEKVENASVVCNEGTKATTIFAGTEYTCSYYNKQLFFIDVPWHSEWKYDLIWTIDGQSDTANTKLENDMISSTTGNGSVVLNVGSDEKGFILSAELTVYKGNSDIVAKRYRGSANIRVVNRIQINNPPGEVTIGCSYPVDASVWYSYLGEDGLHYDATFDSSVVNSKISWKAEKSSNFADRKEDIWTIPAGQKDTNITASISEIPGVINGGVNDEKHNSKYTTLSDIKELKVLEPQYTLTLLDKSGNNSIEINPDQTVTLNAKLTLNGNPANPDRYEWKCTYNGQDYGDGGTVLSGNDVTKTFKLADYAKNKKGTYIITVTCYTNNYRTSYTATYTVVVK